MKKFWLKLFSVFFVLLLWQIWDSAAFCAETKFTVLSDVHIATSKKDTGSRNLTHSINYLQKAIKQVNASDTDFVIFPGDVLDRADKYSLVMFAKIVSELEKPYYIIAGNHDVAHAASLDKKEFYRVLNKFANNKIHNVPCAKVMKNGLVFIFMDGVNQYIPSAAGYFKESELIWLESKLNKYKNKKVVIIQHFPLVAPNIRKTHITYKADEYLKILSNYDNVIAIISGHYHYENEIVQDNILHISAPALIEDGEYKEIIIEQGIGKENYIIKSKMFSVK